MYTGESIVELSRNSLAHKTWNGDDPRPAFASGTFTTNNWNCAAANLIRDVCEELDNKLCWGDMDSWLNGDIDDDMCWFDHSGNAAGCIARVGAFDVMYFWFEDMTLVFFVGTDHTYFVQWYKSRGRTEWILIMDGVDMNTCSPVTAQEYADLLNGIGDVSNAQPIEEQYEFTYPFALLDELENKMCAEVI